MYKGIFWKIIEFEKSYFISVKNVCNEKGELLDKDGNVANTSDRLNHKEKWDKIKISNKPFNYYPRGRVEIKNEVCKIFLSPYLCNNEDINEIKRIFEIKDNDFKKVCIIADNSKHYQYLAEL